MLARRIRQVLALGLVAGGSALGAGACADSESTFYIAYAIPADAECVASPDGDIYIPEGALDITMAQSYTAFLVVHNEIVEQGDPDRPKTETSRVIVYDSEVSVEDPVSGYATEYSWPLAGFVPEGPDGTGVVSVLMLDQSSVANISASLAPNEVRPVLVTVKLFGRTTGGLELESPEWTFAINIGQCTLADCSAEFAEESETTPGVFIPCTKEADPSEICHVGQDKDVPCNSNAAAAACCGAG